MEDKTRAASGELDVEHMRLCLARETIKNIVQQRGVEAKHSIGVRRLLNDAVDIEREISRKESAATVLKCILDADGYTKSMNELTKLIAHHDAAKLNKKRVNRTVKKVDSILRKADKRDDLLVPLQDLVSNTASRQDYITAGSTYSTSW
jgi:hypothetical protein